jgi:hypothetical protein
MQILTEGHFGGRTYFTYVIKCRGVATCSIGNGYTVLFWLDVLNGHLLQEKLLRFFSFAKNKKNQLQPSYQHQIL